MSGAERPNERGEVIPSEVEVAISFAVTVNGEAFTCGKTYANIGTSAADFGFNDMRLYVHDVFLIDEQGEATPVTLDQDGVWQRDGVALLDFEDGCENGTQQVNQALTGTALDGEYSGVRFTVGVPPELNSSETVLEGRGSPLNQTAMFWTWKSGYKYLRLDGDQGPFRLHLGASGCSDDFTCTEMNLVEVTLTGYDRDAHDVTLDLGDLLAGTDVSQNTAGTAPGCMGESVDPDCSDIFQRIGLGSIENRSSWSVTPKGAAEAR
ncbi:MAG: MbnP family copper-binding protein [Myxococcota bacterium]